MLRIFEKGIAFIIAFFALTTYAGEMSSKMISSGWLRTNLYKSQIKIIDIRPLQSYYKGHIPGAVYLNTESVRLSMDGIPHQPISTNAFVAILGNLGINENSSVIIYGNEDDLQPFYLIWMFDYIGHKDVALLEGGYEKWRNEGRPVTQDLPKVEDCSYPAPKRNIEEIRANKNDILKAISSNNAILVDVESPETFSGIKGNCKRKGHIKNAINQYWRHDIIDLYIWKNIDFLKNRYSSKGIPSDKKVILVCEDGWSAAHSYYTLRYIIGIPSVKIYDGGMGEWANTDDLPMETSPSDIQTSENRTIE
jgi:thiosulfate/3-mercaptopyruvate sulfurtransferase